MNTKSKLALTLSLALGAVAVNAEPDQQIDTIGEALIEGNTLAVVTDFAMVDGVRLTVSGGGHWEKREFAAGELVEFDLDSFGNLPDGKYKYELRTQPLDDTADMSEAAEEGLIDDDELARMEQRVARETAALVKIQGGRFEVQDGVASLLGQAGEIE